MPYISNSLSLEVVFETQGASDTYSYAVLDLATEIPEESQLRPRWEVAQVEVDGSPGTFVQTAELSPTVRDQIFNLAEQYYSVNIAANTLTLDPSLSGAVIPTVDSDNTAVSYVMPALSTVSSASPLKIRRSTNIENAVVDFQSGGRLTAKQLNSSAQQLLFASQELLSFGAEAGTAEVSLDGVSINQLGDVNINTANNGAIIVVGPDGKLTDSQTGGVQAVLTVNNQTGNVTLDFTDVGAAPAVHTHVMADVTDLGALELGDLNEVDLTTFAPVIGDTITWTGTSWVAAERVTFGSGTGIPPTSWSTDPKRQAGDLYIRLK